MLSRLRPWLAALIALAAWAQAAPSSGQEQGEGRSASAGPPRRLVVDRFQGPGANVPRAGAIAALEAEDSVDLLSVRLLEKHRALLDGSPEGYAKVGERLDLTALVRGKVKAADGGFRITLNVHDGRSGKALARLTFEAKTLAALRDELRRELWAELERILEQRSATSSPDPDESESEAPEPESIATSEQQEDERREPEPEPERPTAETAPVAESEVSTSEPPSTAKRRCDWLTIEASGGTVSRWFDYVGEQRGALRAFKLRPVPYARLGATAYPFVRPKCRGASGLGLALAHERPFGIHSELAGDELATEAFASRADLVWRIGLGPVRVTPQLGHVWERFAVGGDFVPDVDYHAPRLGLELGLELGWFRLELGGGLRYVLDAGELTAGAWFPAATGYGYDARAGIGVALFDWLDVLGGFELGEYSFSFNATADGDYPHGLADGAFDRYGRGSLILRFHVR